MAKYKLKALSVQLGGKLFRKEDGKVFDDQNADKGRATELQNAYKAGFLEKVKEPKTKTSTKSTDSKKS